MRKVEGHPTAEEITAWYRTVVQKHQGLADSVIATINSLLKTNGIAFLSVSTRVKTLESVLEKFERKEYKSYEALTDMVGARIIVYLEPDIAKACALLKSAFKVHPDLGVDKSEELAVDQIGYRSVHYICDLGEKRVALDELIQYREMKFEVQVRTVLQHAWAEIEHDRSYKFPGDLPPQLRRRLNLLAGALELVDYEFSVLAEDLDKYAKRAVHLKASSIPPTQELDAAVVGLTLDEEPFKRDWEGGETGSLAIIVDELYRFGVTDVGKLRELLSSQYLTQVNNSAARTKGGFLRRAMIFADVDKYFAQAWGRDWRSMSSATRKIVKDKYGEDKLKEITLKYLSPANEKKKAHG